MENLWNRLLCWWLGCVPDYDAVHYDSARDGWTDAVPCKRCGASDTTYGDRVGDTRKNRVAAWLRYWLWRRWWPARCQECGQKGGKPCDCPPF